MTIGAIIGDKGRTIVSATRDMLVSEAVALLAEKRIGAVPVMEGGAVIGIFSERDVIYGLASMGAAMLDRRVGDVMTSPALTVSPDDGVMSALSLMTRRRIRHLPVVRDGTAIAVVSIGDLVKYRIDRIEADAAAMLNYIQGA